jgi:hypothetical protein
MEHPSSTKIYRMHEIFDYGAGSVNVEFSLFINQFT